ncbi:MAG TPA: phosphoribosyl-ATP diphosphatase, partial [Longimicrobiaceae bacterium]|nr:phosphoribosyl-ATP diphosphatase [Longimicrobiaceae bacterium]
HTGERTCFHRTVDADGALSPAPDARPVLARLEEVLAARRAERPEGSYATRLFAGGLDRILRKVGEEAAETIIAAKNEGTAELRAEAADLLFHLLVLCREKGLPLDEVLGELEQRFGAAPRPGSAG